MLTLVGKITTDGWLVERPVEFPADHTGGHFSNCFYVTKSGHTAFLKTLDIEKFEISELLPNLAAFQYETELVGLHRYDL